jgi:hypothetical protein
LDAYANACYAAGSCTSAEEDEGEAVTGSI